MALGSFFNSIISGLSGGSISNFFGGGSNSQTTQQAAASTVINNTAASTSQTTTTTKPTITGTVTGTVTGSTSTVLTGSNKGQTFTEENITTTTPNRTDSAGASALDQLVGNTTTTTTSPTTTDSNNFPERTGRHGSRRNSTSSIMEDINNTFDFEDTTSSASSTTNRSTITMDNLPSILRPPAASTTSSTTTTTTTPTTGNILQELANANKPDTTVTEAIREPAATTPTTPAAGNILQEMANANKPETTVTEAIRETITTPEPEITIPETTVSETIDTNALKVETNKIAGGSTTRTDNVANYIDIPTGEVKQPAISEAIGLGIEATADLIKDTGNDIKLTGEVLFTDPQTGKVTNAPLLDQMESWDKAGVSYEKQIDAFVTTAGVAAIPTGLTVGAGTKIGAAAISKLPAVGKEVTKAAGTVAGFGTLAGAGGETDISKQTSELSKELKEISTGLNAGADTGLEKIGAAAGGFALGIAGGAIDTIGGVTSAGKGIIDTVLEVKDKGLTAGLEKLGEGFDSSLRGAVQWVESIPENPAYSAGELVGFGKSYQTISKAPGKIADTLGKEIGLVDSRIVDAGETIISKNPLLTSAVASGAVESGGFLRIDSAPRATIKGTEITALENTGSRIEIKSPTGKELFVAGRANPLSKTGEIDLARSQREYQDIAKQEGIPFIYGTEQFGKAGTVLGMLDRSPEYLSSKAAKEITNAILPVDISIKTGRIVSYDLTNPVKIGDRITTSKKDYSAGTMTEAYNALSGKQEKIVTANDFAKDTGLTPTLTPKQAGGYFRDIAESEHAWGNIEGINPEFRKTAFGGFTTTGIPITKLGSNQNILTTLLENRAANKDTLKNPYVRTTDGILDLKKGQSDVINYFARDSSFRLAELVGKPRALDDITEHGSQHVENVVKIATALKAQNPKKYGNVPDKEIYFAGILHDLTKNTAKDTTPGGHGEMAGSIILSGASLDARKYLKPEAVPEFENILGKAGTERYNKFLEEFEELTPKEKKRIAAAVSHHTTNLKGALGQTHRITESKLGQLISDADRIELRRFSSDPDSFTPKQKLMFSNTKAQRQAIKDVFGETGDNRPQVRTRTAERAFNQEKQKPAYPYGKTDRAPFRIYAAGEPKISGYGKTGTGKTTIYGNSKPDYDGPKISPTGKNYTDNPYKNTAGGYSVKGNSKQYSSIAQAMKIADLETPLRKKKEEDNLDDLATFRTLKTQRLDHFGIYDPLEFVGRGSMTRRETRKGKALSEVTTFKRTIYEDAGGYTTRKPKGKTRR